MSKKPDNPCPLQRETTSTDLPIDIIINILKRLSFKSLYKFHFVSKLWHALVYSRQIAPHIVKISDTKFTLRRNIDASDSPVICRFKIPIELLSLEYMLLKPVNGILCIMGPVFSHVTYVYLWNPLTSEFKSLPRPKVKIGYDAMSFGFGYVPSTDDYKVVRVIKHRRKGDWRVEIYSLNRGSWRRVRDPCTGNEITHWSSKSNRVDLEKEVITDGADNSMKHCRTSTWIDNYDGMMLTWPEDDLVLCQKYRDRYSCYRSSKEFDFSGSFVSLNRDHDGLGS